MDIFILYIEMIYNRMTELLAAGQAKLMPYYIRARFYALRGKGYIMDLFLRDLISEIRSRWSAIDFSKPYPLSSKYGIAYIFMIVIALNLTGFNILLTGSNGGSDSTENINFLSTVKKTEI